MGAMGDAEDPNIPRFVKVGRAGASTPREAVEEAAQSADIAATCFVLAFIPQSLDADETCKALGTRLPSLPVFGCTTAGQITSDGYEDEALLLLFFPRAHFRCASVLFDELAPISTTRVASVAQRMAKTFRYTAGWNRLALLFSDGLSKQEDLLISTLDTVLAGWPTFGGSAADGFRFEKSFVLHNGQAHENAAVLLLVETDLEFQGLGVDHFLPVGAPIVITAADPDERIVYEIDGAPAALAYAHLVGCPVDQLSPEVFSENPMLIRHNRKHFVRAVRGVSDNHAMSFLAAIDDGLVLTLGRGREIIETLETGLTISDPRGSAPDFILGFDCALRKLEFEKKQLHRKVSDILRKHRVYGFNTYGEQHFGIHMNQTFVGVAFFEPEERAMSV